MAQLSEEHEGKSIAKELMHESMSKCDSHSVRRNGRVIVMTIVVYPWPYARIGKGERELFLAVK